MTFHSLIREFGYLAVFIGTFLEGETILVVAGFVAYEAYLQLPLVVLAAFLGSLFGDQLYFFIGRYKGRSLLKKYPTWESRVSRFRKLMDRHGTWFILIFRFLYGLRTVAPFAIGLSNVTLKKFIVLNVISAAIWAATLGVLGYFFGQVMEAVLHDIKKYELIIMAGLFIVAAVIFLIRHIRNRRRIKLGPRNQTDDSGVKAN
jgi:membrane protein DedA with SNARE-associated domain